MSDNTKLEDDMLDLRKKILSVAYDSNNLSAVYRHGPYGRTHFREVGLLADMMLIQLEYITNDSGAGGHDGGT